MDVLNDDNNDCIILGLGYVGNFFLMKYPKTKYTVRKTINPKNEQSSGIYFDLNDKLSWKNIPTLNNVLWTFPAANNEFEMERAISFFTKHLKNKKVIILSTTSAYVTNTENETVDENHPIKLNEARFQTEEALRKKGALILHLSGIIGPNRTPLSWYLKNRVLHSKNILNYIYIEDIIFFIDKLFDKFTFSERFNLTSGDYKQHKKIASELILKNCLNEDYMFLHNNSTKESKKISNHKILDYTQYQSYLFKKYPDEIET